MTHVRMTTHFDAPIERVYEFATDFKRYPEWNVNYVEVKEVLGPIDRPGTKVHSVMKLLGRRMEGTGEIVEVDPPRLIKMSGTGPSGSLTFVYRFSPDTTGTKVELDSEYELPAGIFGQVADKLFIERAVERDLHHSMDNAKAFIEAKIPVLT